MRFVCFLTDGYIGNEAEILGEIHKRLGPSRIFSFGIGSAVNRYLIANMGKAGRGAVAWFGPRDEAAAIMENFFERISHPALADLQLEVSNSAKGTTEIFPGELPDLFVGRPVVVTGRLAGDELPTINIRGKVAGEIVGIDVPRLRRFPAARKRRRSGSIWARSKISDLAERSL